MSADVTTVHDDYALARQRWRLVEDAAAGESAVKEAEDCYLPRPNAQDKSRENKIRYQQYLERAVYYNATGRTLRALVGLAFMRTPDVSLPAPIDYANEDISGTGLTLTQHAQRTLGEVLKTARAGLLVDYPKTVGAVSIAEQATGDIRPTICFYPALHVINWRTRRIGGKVSLSMVTLFERHEEAGAAGAIFDMIVVEQYRVLYINEDGNYQADLWRYDTPTKMWGVYESYVPVRADGTPWKEIPFVFVGSENNDWRIDPAPLYDIAVLNVAHYRNSADYEESVYQVGQPMYWIGGLTETWRDHMEAQGTYIGSRRILLLPPNSQAGILQASPNSMAKEAMDCKEVQMAALGAKLIQQSTATRTATEVLRDDATARSVLTTCCANVSAAYTKALGWFSQFAGAGDGATLSIPTDFTTLSMDATMLTALLQLVQAGKMPETDLWLQLRRAGLIDQKKTDDDIRNEIEAEGPTGALDLGPAPVAGAAAAGAAPPHPPGLNPDPPPP